MSEKKEQPIGLDKRGQIKADVLAALYLESDNTSEKEPLSKYGVKGDELADALIQLESRYHITLPLDKIKNTNVTLAQIINVVAEKLQEKDLASGYSRVQTVRATVVGHAKEEIQK